MTVTALASTSDVSKALGRNLTDDEQDRVQHVLDLLSEKFRTEAAQTFSVETYTHRLKADGGLIRFPRTPLVDVTGVVSDNTEALQWVREGNAIRIPSLGSDGFALVTYTAGFDHVPDAVRLQIADEAQKIISINPKAREGYTQTTEVTGPLTDGGTFGAWAVGGQAMLSPEGIALAKRFRPRKVGRIWVMAP
ncbi:MAG: hypothetical protein ABF453_02890 [Bifidobacterium psychraerophilum]|uniref:hypothetical protein n=1 Tax=Bifidobacterium psychraerophilum TaxID=218140 RepID=UPI0039EAF7B5